MTGGKERQIVGVERQRHVRAARHLQGMPPNGDDELVDAGPSVEATAPDFEFAA